MVMIEKFLHNKTKRIFQAAILILILMVVLIGWISKTYTPDYEAYCPFGGLLSLGSKTWLGSMSCSMSENQAFMGLALLVGIILLGKLFCGYLCPIGTVIEWLRRLIGKRLKIDITLSGIADRVLRVGKYVLLFFAAYFTITSSELWCKKFDPYYATLTGFGSDTILLWGITSIFAVVILSIFIRFFWCKYACPLSALSNIISNILISAPIVVVYLLVRLIGWDLPILWLILALCVSGAFTEIFRYKFYTLTPISIRVDHDKCIACSLCNRACPQGIEVSSYEKVTHPDCTLCLDCVKSCKTEDSIHLYKKHLTWLPPVAIIMLIIGAMLLSKTYEFKTLSERWGNFNEVESLAKFEMTGLKTVKCFGSSKSLQNQISHKKGIVGLDTYVKSHRVTVYYDSSLLDETGVKEAIFRPSQYKVRDIDPGSDSLSIFQIGVDGLWDLYDNAQLVRMLGQNPHIYGLETSFGEPVLVNIYYLADGTNPDEIMKIIEQKSYRTGEGNEAETIKVDFECNSSGALIGKTGADAFMVDFFSGYDQKFNKYSSYDSADLKIYEIGLPDAEDRAVRLALRYLSSHLSFNDGIVRVHTLYNKKPVLQVFYDPTQIATDEIYTRLTAPMFQVMRSDGTTYEKENPLRFGDPAIAITE